jgi:hypothetical protein
MLLSHTLHALELVSMFYASRTRSGSGGCVGLEAEAVTTSVEGGGGGVYVVLAGDDARAIIGAAVVAKGLGATGATDGGW